ncbi:hypothetical protein TBLA_0B05410 [Henningerozyma blattae CBS 6284]|uniref:Phosphatidic acid phosphatase type 2/haloperoxidase domain-containing protein n=1 Tax=Henningerozyma blattae (strain ATCC 34711 / CBS 6284 / DSM 70876 / NBRC 10599 / NRRL Y-10934 / UCD 77-7) TaxID=1071380 RepID=I2GZ18_HENB6|nr:hypothetical protein TBLA_0B05410 [Tetrapisispora blattae CBS 6284]CCH59370.1 hypothetical protein TBLA_0B05410 [Tetrapisispora blattae CBS 6284]
MPPYQEPRIRSTSMSLYTNNINNTNSSSSSSNNNNSSNSNINNNGNGITYLNGNGSATATFFKKDQLLPTNEEYISNNLQIDSQIEDNEFDYTNNDDSMEENADTINEVNDEDDFNVQNDLTYQTLINDSSLPNLNYSSSNNNNASYILQEFELEQQPQNSLQLPRKKRPRSLSDPMDILETNVLNDPGNHPSIHFKSKMSSFRFATRCYLKQFTDNQSQPLYAFQLANRNNFKDYFFAYSSLLGSHNFYLIFLPIPPWIGQYELIVDMVYILAYTIYISGFLKDFWCLPRPKSPPLHRITLSDYTAREYGAPSSHTANATGMSLLLFWYVNKNDYLSLKFKVSLYLITLIYHFTLVIGRLYCGMHGMLDLISGTFIGIFVFQARLVGKWLAQGLDKSKYFFLPIISLAWGFLILFKHVRPIDECPCFEDSVAFIGVIGGLEITDWVMKVSGFTLVDQMKHNTDLKTVCLRLLIGVPCVIIWKAFISKPLIYSIMLKCGVKDDREERIKLREDAEKKHKNECIPYIGIPVIDIIGRYFIYSGIPPVTLLFCPFVFRLFGVL